MTKLNELPSQTRVWVYQADREMTSEEQGQFLLRANEFVESWTSHASLMSAAIELRYGRFAILAADEAAAKASGCGIDKSVRFFQEIGAELNLDFFNRTLVWYRDGQNKIISDPLNVFWARRKAGNISGSTLVFNNLISNLGALETSWEIPFEKSWHQEAWSR
jgi:hypothetical protein